MEKAPRKNPARSGPDGQRIGERPLPGAAVVRFGLIPGGPLRAPPKGAGWIQSY